MDLCGDGVEHDVVVAAEGGEGVEGGLEGYL